MKNNSLPVLRFAFRIRLVAVPCWAIVFGFLLILATQAAAQSGNRSPQPSNRSLSAAQLVRGTGVNETEFKKVGFRLTTWRTIHASSLQVAQENIAALTKIGCEVESDNHGDHTDIRYRCLQWKAMELPSDQLVVQWTGWLAQHGLETVIIDPLPQTSPASVSFRLPRPQTIHLDHPEQAQEIVSTLAMIGAEVSQVNHGDHLDLTYSCPRWKTIGLSNEQSAHVWQEWLNRSGFETEHQHGAHQHDHAGVMPGSPRHGGAGANASPQGHSHSGAPSYGSGHRH